MGGSKNNNAATYQLVLLALGTLLILQLASAASYYGRQGDVQEDAPLRPLLGLSYVLNDLGAGLPQDAGFPHTPAGGGGGYGVDPNPEEFAEGTNYGREGDNGAWNQYSNNAGDAQYTGNTRLGQGVGDRDSEGYASPHNNNNINNKNNVPYFSHPGQEGPLFSASSDNKAVHPLDHIYPFGEVDHRSPSHTNPLKGSSSSSAAAAAAGGLSSFGHSLDDARYPEEQPSSSQQQPEAQYFGAAGGENYQPINRQILPDPYSGLDVPYAVLPPKPPHHQSGHDVIDDARDTPHDVFYDGDSLSSGGRGSHGQNPQGSYRTDVPSDQGLSGILFPPKDSDSIVSSPSLGVDDHGYGPDVVPPAHGHFYPDAHVGDDGGVDHVGGGGSVVRTNPYPGSAGVGGQNLIGAVAAGSGGGSGGGYEVVPHHSYLTNVQEVRDNLQCWPQFFLQYENDFSGVVWQDVKGQVHVQQGRAVFQGQGYLAIPFFACNDLLPRYSMIFVISPSYNNGGQPQAVLGNSLFSGQASLLVSLLGNTLTLVVRQRAPNLTPHQLLQQCQSSHQHQPGQQDIVVMQLTISGEVTVTIAQENDWIFFGAGEQNVSKAGRLPTLTNEALYVGAGADPRGGQELDHYSGTFDSFLFEKCP